MRRTLYFLIMCLSLSLVSAQNKWLNNKKQIMTSFSQEESKFEKKYYQFMSQLIEPGLNEKKQKSVENKLLIFFGPYLSHPNSDVSDCANYQLGHYYAFGVFDPFYSRDAPSAMNREVLTAVDKNVALAYLNRVPSILGKLRLVPNLWLTDYEKGMGQLFCENYSYIDEEKLDYLMALPDFHPNLFTSGKYTKEVCHQDHPEVPSLEGILFFMKFLCALPDEHPCKSQLQLDMSKEDVVSLALNFQDQGKYYEAMYYGLMAAFRGDVNGLITGINAFAHMYNEHYRTKHPKAYQAGFFFANMELLMIKHKDFSDELKPFAEVFDNLRQYYNDMGDKYFESFIAKQEEEERALQAAKEKQREERWANFLNAIGQTMMQLGSQYAMSSGTSQYTPQYTPQFYNMSGGGLNALIDPRYAMNQVYNQYYDEYLQFSAFNKKPDGSNYTFDEYMALNAQALNNLKKQGVDLVAEQRQLNEENRKQFEKEIEEDRENRLKQLKARSGEEVSSDTPVEESNTGVSTGGSKTGGSSSQTGGSSNGESTTVGVKEDPKVDATEQFKTDPVSSSEYRKLKTVNLYGRDGDYAKMRFQNVGLYRKGATDYIRIENKFYPRRSPNWQRFQNAIDYGGIQLYYND